jgi:hypothetical protein
MTKPVRGGRRADLTGQRDRSGVTPGFGLSRDRLSRAGNRQINPGAAHHGHRPAAHRHRRPRLLRPKKASGTTSMEAMRCLKRRLTDIVYRRMVDHAITHSDRPGGQRGHDSHSSATGSHPHTGCSDKPIPGPATEGTHEGAFPIAGSAVGEWTYVILGSAIEVALLAGIAYRRWARPASGVGSATFGPLALAGRAAKGSGWGHVW